MTAIYIKDFFFFNVFKFGLGGATDAPVGQEEKKTHNFLKNEGRQWRLGIQGLFFKKHTTEFLGKGFIKMIIPIYKAL